MWQKDGQDQKQKDQKCDHNQNDQTLHALRRLFVSDCVVNLRTRLPDMVDRRLHVRLNVVHEGTLKIGGGR